MEILNPHLLEDCMARHPGSILPLRRWIERVGNASWSTPLDARQSSSGVTSLGHGRLLFDIRRNRYRLVARVDYTHGTVEVRFSGDHSEYDRIDVMEV